MGWIQEGYGSLSHADATEKNEEKKIAGGFAKPGHGRQPHGGRKPGPNKVTRVLKEAILLAAEIVGNDGKGKDGLVGFLVAEASKVNNKPFMNLLGRVLPATLKAGNDKNLQHHVTVEFVRAEPRPQPKLVGGIEQRAPLTIDVKPSKEQR